MPVFQKLLDLGMNFQKLSEPPIIINDLSNITEDSREHIKELITTRYSSDMVSLLPSCPCGITKGEFTKTKICHVCGHPVKSVMDGAGESVVWFRRPAGVAKLLNPAIWMQLNQRYKKGRFSIINWITDTKYDPNTKKPVAILNKLIDFGIKRGYNNFVENFDSIMAFLFSLKEFQSKSVAKSDDRLYELIQIHRNRIFSDYIPIPNKSILLIEKTVFSTYVDTSITNAVNAIQMLVSIDRDFHDQSVVAKENRTVRGMSALFEFYYQYFTDNIASKPGQIRRHLLGSRTVFGGRAVISSITGPHSYDEIQTPWGMTLVIFRQHLLNKMRKLGMSKNSAVSMIYAHIEKYSELLDGLLKEIIAEFPGGRVPLTLNRNPSLLQGSILALNLRNFKSDHDENNRINDRTIGISILIVRHLGADFDGKSTNVAVYKLL